MEVALTVVSGGRNGQPPLEAAPKGVHVLCHDDHGVGQPLLDGQQLVPGLGIERAPKHHLEAVVVEKVHVFREAVPWREV